MPDTLGGWTLLEIVGRGAAGTVWRATDFTRTVTVKIATDDPKAAHSLAHEGRILARLDHPNLPRLIETFENPPALVLDAPPGQTYGDLLARGKLWTQPLRQRLETLTIVAGALDRLHGQKIIHRDVKPAHITAGTPPLLFDFGIAQTASTEKPPDLNAGTAAYMPPPGEPVSAARDAYAFGVTTYEMLFGAHPLLVAADRDIAPVVLRQRAADKIKSGTWRKPSGVPQWELPPDLRAANVDVLDDLFATALGTPEARPALLAKWMAQITACIPLEDRAISVAPEVVPEAFAPAHTAHEVAAAQQTDQPFSRLDWRLVALCAVIAAAAALLLWLARG